MINQDWPDSPPPGDFNDYARQIMSASRRSAIPNVAWVWREGEMTAADLGIVDQNLDDKVGMEP